MLTLEALAGAPKGLSSWPRPLGDTNAGLGQGSQTQTLAWPSTQGLRAGKPSTSSAPEHRATQKCDCLEDWLLPFTYKGLPRVRR